MGPYWVQFLVRSHRLIFTLIGLFIVFILCCWGFGKVVDAFVPAYASLWSDRLHIKLSFERARYVFPHRILLKNLRILDAADPKEPMIEIPRATLDFSSSRAGIILSKMTLEHVTASVPVLNNYLKRSASAVWQEFKQLSQSNINVSLTDTRLYLYPSDQKEKPVSFKVDFSLSQGDFKSKLYDGESTLQLWGYWKSERFALSGYMFYQGPLLKQPVNIIDIKGFLNVDAHDATLKELSFNINGNKFQATAHAVQQDLWPYEARMTCSKPTQNIETNLRGEIVTGMVSVEGAAIKDLIEACMDPKSPPVPAAHLST